MPNRERSYIAIDLKSFYASVECRERGLDPLNTNLVVADASRTEKTICLAVSPSLKQYGIPGRPRLFEVVQKVKEINAQRKSIAPGRQFQGSSYLDTELKGNTALELQYITAPPRMALYIDYSTRIYDVYLRYIAPEDIHVYSIDEVFMDVTAYLRTYKLTPHELARKMIHEVMEETGITATAGIGTNLYLCKVAMDIVAKHVPADKDGVRIAELDEMSYRRLLWNHVPLTDFWRVGRGYEKRLLSVGIFTMGDIARCSLGKPEDFYNEDLLYKLFGINAELLIDHAWGWEPATMQDIKAYRPETKSISSGQVLPCPYDAKAGRLIVQEMTDLLVLDLVEKRVMTDQMVLVIGYDAENLSQAEKLQDYKGKVSIDYYGRPIPKHAQGSVNLGEKTSSTKVILDAVLSLYDRIIDPALTIRRVNVVANNLILESEINLKVQEYEQMDLFTDYQALEKKQEALHQERQKERQIQEAVLSIKKKYGKNAVLKGMNLQEGAMTAKRNAQIGGHQA